MGLPSISIEFKTKGISAIKRGERGVVALILKDAAETGFHSIVTIDDIPSGLSQDNIDQIKLAMMGTINPPKKVIAYVLANDALDYNAALTYLEAVKWDYIAVPCLGEGEGTDFATWIKQLRGTKDKKVKAVLPNEAADHEGIVNFISGNVQTANDTFTATEYCSRIAGILAGLPLTVASTFQVLPEVLDVDHLTKEELDTAIDAGKLVLMNDGEKVKIARGVNSLVTTTAEKGEDFKKITIVDKLDLIHDDVKRTAEDNYIGKMTNSYDNKVLLISAIQGYYDQLELDGILDKGKNSAVIDIPAQTAYLKGIGEDTDSMNEQEIKEANTKDKVFLASNIKPLDAMEEIKLNIGI